MDGYGITLDNDRLDRVRPKALSRSLVNRLGDSMPENITVSDKISNRRNGEASSRRRDVHLGRWQTDIWNDWGEETSNA